MKSYKQIEIFLLLLPFGDYKIVYDYVVQTFGVNTQMMDDGCVTQCNLAINFVLLFRRHPIRFYRL